MERHFRFCFRIRDYRCRRFRSDLLHPLFGKLRNVFRFLPFLFGIPVFRFLLSPFVDFLYLGQMLVFLHHSGKIACVPVCSKQLSFKFAVQGGDCTDSSRGNSDFSQNILLCILDGVCLVLPSRISDRFKIK